MASVPVGSTDPALPGDRDLDVRYYVELVWRHRAFLGACALVGLVLGLVVAFVQTPEYQAAVLVQIEPPPPPFASVSDALLGGRGATGRTPTSTTRSSRCCAPRASARRWSRASS